MSHPNAGRGSGLRIPSRKSSRCLVVFIIGFGLQIRDYRRKPEQDKTMALAGLI